jgi:hypothetical protein
LRGQELDAASADAGVAAEAAEAAAGDAQRQLWQGQLDLQAARDKVDSNGSILTALSQRLYPNGSVLTALF